MVAKLVFVIGGALGWKIVRIAWILKKEVDKLRNNYIPLQSIYKKKGGEAMT